MDKALILKLYREGKSPYEISDELGTYPNKIRRILKALGEPIRTKGEAQSAAIASGRHCHPTKGRERGKQTKEKISEGVYSHWKNMDEEERTRRVDMAKEQWVNMTDVQKATLKDESAKAIRTASKEGSKLEIFLRKSLTEAGFPVIFHKKGLIPSQSLEIDLFMPTLNVAIEIDGPSHFLPIWGEERLRKHITSDAKKAGLLLSHGYILIRVKCTRTNISEKYKRDVSDMLITALEKIKSKPPKQNHRFIELEIK